MVRVISYEQAVEQGETPATIQHLVDWHEGAITFIERSRKPSRKEQRAIERHRSVIAALRTLAKLLGKADVAAQAA